MPTSRGWLKAHGAMVVVCGLFTLVIGLDIWFETLKTRENLGVLWNQQSNDIQSLLQRGVRLSLSPPRHPSPNPQPKLTLSSSTAAATSTAHPHPSCKTQPASIRKSPKQKAAASDRFHHSGIISSISCLRERLG